MKKLLLAYLTIAFLIANITAQEVELEWAFSQGEKMYPNSTFEDFEGNIYVIGCYRLTADFDPGPLESIFTTSNINIFIQKLTPNKELIWIKTIIGEHIGSRIKSSVDIEGNIYITGEFSDEIDFDPSLTSEQLRISTNGSSNFILKLNIDGEFNWVKTFKGGQINSNKPDSNGDIIFTGFFSDSLVFDQQNTIEGLGHNVYIAKINPSGSFEWIRRNSMEPFGGTSIQPPLISIDENNNIYGVGKYLYSTLINANTATETSLTTTGGGDTYLYKLNEEGQVQWAKGFQESTINVTNINVDSDDIILTGKFTGSVDFDLGNSDFILSTETSELFLIKYSDNTDLQWCVKFGKSEENEYVHINHLEIDNDGKIYIGGQFTGSTSLDPSDTLTTYTTQEARTAFLSKFSNEGTYVWSNYYESSLSIAIRDMFVDNSNNIYIIYKFATSMTYDPNDPSLLLYGFYSMAFQKINQLSPSSSFNINNVTNIDVFPNPTSDIINITSQEEITSIKIINNLGQVINLYNDIKSNPFTCSLGENPGLFYLQITSKENTITRPIIKE